MSVVVPLLVTVPVIFKCPAFWLSITKEPSLLVIVPETSRSLLLSVFVNVASPVFTKDPPITILPALFVTVAVPLFAAFPLIFKPPAPVFSIASVFDEIFPLSLILRPPAPWFV